MAAPPAATLQKAAVPSSQASVTVVLPAGANLYVDGQAVPGTSTTRQFVTPALTPGQEYYLGKNHSDNSIVMRFPDERVLFAVDFIPVRSLPFRDFPDAYINEWIESLAKAEALDFDILAPGHGGLGRKDDVRAMRAYMEELRTEVLRHLREGKSVEEIKQLVTMEKYRAWGNYKEYLPLNIEGMVRHIQMHRIPN